ncbi:Cap3p [Coprinopsis cinerea okayama7|uniref:Cap3p n=1 Tax=Coprinopsis cinerea (strain Okayama-7 / 130 / ATCC MYA-4618 / FGSC 9003) TaxID=240176 RepID=A8NCQ8_COPC7|nr:Cap3p [Coprinopsis cinerea okayama7\|eukprot:XP_001832602.1 Cap3p [Coprinopsis cinerea okayama7\
MVSFRLHRLPLRTAILFILLAVILCTQVSSWIPSFDVYTHLRPHDVEEERPCKVDNLVLTRTATTTVFSPPQTVTVQEPVHTTESRDVFGFPVVGSRAPPPSDAVDETRQTTHHFYRDDGLLEVNPDGPHPIFELMEQAEQRWKKKNEKASRTLKEACEEYERRYNRKPPHGFDVWWIYVQSYDVRLPDEYDQISKNMEPFWGIDPRRLQQIQRDWEDYTNTFTVGKETDTSPIEMVNHAFDAEGGKSPRMTGAKMVADILEEVSSFLSPFRAVFSSDDNPNLHTDYELMKMAIQAGKEGRYIDIDNPPPVKLDGWISACPPDSPAWVNRVEYTNPLPPLPELSRMKHNTAYASSPSSPEALPPKTFIHNHKLSMDPCLHPAHLLMHGQFISHERGPVPHRLIIPQFSFSPTSLHHDITVALSINWIDDIRPRGHDPLFDDKDDERLQWRGSNTGSWFGGNTQWWVSHRTRLVDWANPRRLQPSTVDSVLWSPPDSRWKVGEPSVPPSKSAWAPAMADIAFANKPISCAPEVCNGRLAQEYEFRHPHNIPTQGKYKYIIDVDGNAWSSRFKRLITSNSLIFKSTIYQEWFADRIEPWLHYVPIQIDYSDLLDALYFFRGDPGGRGAHPELAKKIAEAGREWSLTHWRRADLTAYMFRLFLEYTRIMSPERENGGLDYVYDEADEFDPDVPVFGAEEEAEPRSGQSLFLRAMEKRRQCRAP